jgi:hypothetical protein
MSFPKGRQIYSKVIRNGTEVEYLTNGKYYNFKYQYVNYLYKPVNLYPVSCNLNIWFILVYFSYLRVCF